MAVGVIDELLVGLGFDYDPKDLEQFNKDIGGLTSTIKAFAKVVIGTTAALVGFTTATTAATDRQGKLSKQTGVSVGEIDALEFALKRAGGQSESMGNNLDQLAIRISETSRGMGSGIEAFGILGLSVTDANGALKATDRVLLEVSDSLQKFSKAEQIELADKLGLRDSILLLQEGSKGIRKLTAEARAFGVTTKEDALLSEEFQDSLADIFQIVKQVSRVITRALVPAMENSANSFTDWFKANKDIIEQNIPKIIDNITLAFKLLTIAAIGFLSVKLVSALAGLITLFSTLGVRALLANLAIAAIPLLITGIIAAIGLLADDAKGFFEGQESFLGSMITKYPEWGDEITQVAAVFATLAKLTGMIFDGWGQIFKLFTSGTFVDDLLLSIKQVQKDIAKLFDELGDIIRNTFSDIWDDIVDDFSRNVIEPIANKIKAIKEFLGFDDKEPLGKITNEEIARAVELSVTRDALAAELPPIEMLQGMAGITPDPTTGSPFVSRDIANQNTNQIKIDMGGITVDVKGVTGDPKISGKIIGETIKRELEPLLKQASIDLNSAVVI